MITKRPVVVLQLPEKLVLGRAEFFFHEVQEFLNGERPRMVFDFSEVVKLDSAGIEVLLNCMEEVMKRNGDLKLAAIPAGPAVVLELTQVDRLFEIFASATEAAKSFDHFPLPAFSQTQPLWGEQPVAGNESVL